MTKKERFISQKWNITGIKKEVPFYMIKPIIDNPKKAIIYIPGLNGNGSMIKFFKINFENFIFASFDFRAQANNKNKASRFYKKYLKDLNIIIHEFKQKFNSIEEIYLCGESWGATLSLLEYKKYKNVNGVFGWNMPYNLVDVSQVKGWKKFIKILKMVITFFSPINTYDNDKFAAQLTNNSFLKRIIDLSEKNNLNNKVAIAAWRSFKKSWRFLLKNENDEKIKYIQSLEDVLLTKKMVKKARNHKNIIIFDKGYHLLTFDNNVNQKLFSQILSFIE